MAIGDTYCSLVDLKDYLKVPTPNTTLDAALTDALQSSSAEIERICGRQFNKQDGATARIYEPFTLRLVFTEDFWTTDGLVVETDPSGSGDFSTVFGSSDYALYPLNGIVDGQPGWPYRKIKAVSGPYFPRYQQLPYRRTAVVRVTAQWGWALVPAPIKQACLIMSAATLQLKDAPLGVAGMTQFGSPIRVQDNKMAASKLARYIRSSTRVGG